ncbi:sulfotransferase family 2 domain-containing protein [Sulfitobacter aestuarii]|uniref:Sulfotransferase family 2 domain-containing protein n=1 Tax=Sulfitobacter aestuarii TaxID=2161676 RepID=A0ABW5U5Y0_9RHOB
MPLARINGKILHFIHIPKTGGSGISSYLRAKGQVALYSRERLQWARTTPQHVHAETSEILLPDGFADATFAVIRDPMQRLLSEYRYRVTRRHDSGAVPKALDSGAALTVELDWGAEFHGTFDAWVTHIFAEYQRDPHVCDNHVRPQADFIRQGAALFRFEQGMQPVFDWIDRVTGTTRADFRIDRNESIKFEIEMSDETRAAIRRFYAADFALCDRLATAPAPSAERQPEMVVAK